MEPKRSEKSVSSKSTVVSENHVNENSVSKDPINESSVSKDPANENSVTSDIINKTVKSDKYRNIEAKPTWFPKTTDKHTRELIRALSMFTQVGITMVMCVLLGVLFGRFLDSRLDTSPWFLLIFTFSGAGAAIKSVYALSKRF